MVVLVVVVAITMETCTVVAGAVCVRIGSRREGGDGEWYLLVAAKLQGCAVRLRRVRVGPQVQGLTRVEHVLGMLRLGKRIEVGVVHIDYSPSIVTSRVQRQDFQIGASRRVAAHATNAGKTISRQVHSGLEVLPVCHAGAHT